MNRHADVSGLLAAVLEEEQDDRGGHAGREKEADGDDENHQRVDVRREVRSLLRI